MRNLFGIVALTLLAASMGCASDSDPTKTPEPVASDNPFQAIEDAITGLVTKCTIDATGATMSVRLAAGEIAIISKRSVDSAIVVNGEICVLAGATPTPTAALVSKVKTLNVALTSTDGSEMVIVDYTNGVFATGTVGTASTGIHINLGTTGTDVLGVKGTTGNDSFTMLASALRVNTDTAADITLDAAADTTTVFMGTGNDTFTAGAYGAVTVYGGVGDDTFDQTNASTPGEVIYGGDGTDTVTYALRTAAITADIDVTADDGITGENDNIQNDVETIVGGSAADTLTGGGTACTLTGGAGNDTLTGGAGNDTINGGLGNDTLAGAGANDTINGDDDNDTFLGGAGNDTLNGGIGDDTFDEELDTNGDTINGGAGTDTVDYSDRTAILTVTMDGAAANDGEGTENDNIKADVENILGGTANDNITGNVLNNVITGGAGNDVLIGGSGDDIFREGAAASGADAFTGGDGIDTVDYSLRSAALTITIDGTANDGDGTATENDNVGVTVENVYGGGGADSITGSAGDNELVGGAGVDSLYGLAGDDVIEGGDGTTADVIDCGSGDGDIGYGTTGTATNCELHR